MSNKSRAALFLLVLFLMPFAPVITSLIDIRNSVILDETMNWTEGARSTFNIPKASFNKFEFRVESSESKWEPNIKAKWVLFGRNGEVIQQSSDVGEEWNITRPFLMAEGTGTHAPGRLELEFLSTNPEKHQVRLKVSNDRAALLQKSERLFVVLLALSLGLMLVVLKPFWLARAK